MIHVIEVKSTCWIDFLSVFHHERRFNWFFSFLTKFINIYRTSESILWIIFSVIWKNVFFPGTDQKDCKFHPHQFVGEFYQINRTVLQPLFRMYNNWIWKNVDYRWSYKFKTFSNLAETSTIIMIQKLLELSRYLDRYCQKFPLFGVSEYSNLKLKNFWV